MKLVAHYKSYYSKARGLIEHPGTQKVRRIVRRVVATCSVILAVAIVTTVTIDMGPWAKGYAEEQGRQYLRRPMHIGRLSFRLWTGNFQIDDLVIEGLTPTSRKFLVAKRLDVAIPWSTLFDRRFVLQSIEMTDWQMYVEMRDGKHSMPKLTPLGSSAGKSSWTTTLQWVRAHRGEFTYEDHNTPWSVVTRNLDVTVARPGSEYRGSALFSNGTVAIQDYKPFRADMSSTFKIDGGRVIMDKIDLVTDGARSSINGDINLRYWPEQMFRVKSTVDFARMREIFFPREHFALSGTGEFTGYFHLFKDPLPDGTNRTGRELTGTVTSPNAGVDAYRFEDLRAPVKWTPDRLSVTGASASVYGGSAQFGYEMSPLGVRGVRPTSRLEATYQDVSLTRMTDFFELDGLRLAGGASGRVNLQWPIGRYAERTIDGDVRVAPPPGVTLMTRRVPEELIEHGRLPRAPATRLEPGIPVPIGGQVAFRMDPQSITFGGGRVATQRTYVEFEGETTPGGSQSRIPFYASSADWQESYRVFAAFRTALGSPTTAIDIGGSGTFQGVVLNSLKTPRIEGSFAGSRMRAWDVEWGSAVGRAVIENGYADIKETRITSGDSMIETDGRFSLGFPRRDGGEEVNAQVRLSRRPIKDLSHAFVLDRYPIDGVLSGEFHVFGNYKTPFGYGTMELADGIAYGERFDSASADVGLEGKGVRLTGVELTKGTGYGNGAAYVGWDGTYSFDFTGSAVPVESVTLAQRAGLPLSGLIDFTASGSATFAMPRYSVKGAIRDFFVADEGIGQVDIRNLAVIGDTMTIEGEVASPRLAVGVLGRVELTGGRYADVTFTVNDTSLDPYVRALNPSLSPFTTAVVDGSVRVVGELDNLNELRIEAQVRRLALRLFDYPLENSRPFNIDLQGSSVRIADPTPGCTSGNAAELVPPVEPNSSCGLHLVNKGTEDTDLFIAGGVDLDKETIDMTINGTANLAVLQGFVDNISSRGRAMLFGALKGPFKDPLVNGTLTVDNGRIRYYPIPHALENINGTMTFNTRGVSLDGLTARLAEGPVQFGGQIYKNGYLPSQFEITMTGQNMRVRYPLGIEQSRVDATLELDGTLEGLVLSGDVTVNNAVYSKPFPIGGNILALIGGDEGFQGTSAGTALPLTYDVIRISAAPGRVRVHNSGDLLSANLGASAALELRGTYDRPVLSGEIELDPGGLVTFLGKRYTVKEDSIIYFNNPNKIEPSFAIEAETRVRVPGETYRVTLGVTGTCCDRPGDLTLDSDPSLPEAEILALLISDVTPGKDAELRQARSNVTPQEQLLREVATRAAASPLSSPVGRFFEKTVGFDTFQVTPSLVDPSQQSARLDPAARLLIGKQISPKAYLTYSRSLSSSTRDEIILLEIDATDQFSWILSRNEDQTYAIEVRVRRAF